MHYEKETQVITMTEKEKYALEWNNSAQYFYDHKSYKHLATHISKFNTVLEIGCGTGQSTLALLEAGHSVIAIDQNPYCIEKARQLVESAGYSVIEHVDMLSSKSACFIEYDITEPSFEHNILSKISPDVVTCWNVGTYFDKEKTEDVIPKIIEYGLTPQEIIQNIESSYGELILWYTCRIAKSKNCAVHLVDRGSQKITKNNDPYYSFLKREIGFKTIKYANIKGTTLSKGGRQLCINGELYAKKEIPIIFISILMT